MHLWKKNYFSFSLFIKLRLITLVFSTSFSLCFSIAITASNLWQHNYFSRHFTNALNPVRILKFMLIFFFCVCYYLINKKRLLLRFRHSKGAKHSKQKEKLLRKLFWQEFISFYCSKILIFFKADFPEN